MSADGTARSGADRRARQVGELLGASAAGRSNGLSPQLVADLADVYDGTGRTSVTVRVAVLRADTGPASGHRLVPLLTGVRPPGEPGTGDLVPLTYVHEPADLPLLRLTDAQVRGLNRLARALLARPESLARAPLARHGTAAWLRVRAAQRQRAFFRPRYAGQEAVERAWRRIQDVTAAGAAAAPGAAGAVLDVPVRHPFLFHGDPLPWPAAGSAGGDGPGGPRIEVTDLPAPPGGGPSAHLAEALDAAHLVLAAAPHTVLAGEEPLPALFRSLLERGRPGGDRAEVVLVATTSGRRGPGATAALGGWLRGRVPAAVGPAARDLVVHAVAVGEAERALRILRSPRGRPATAVEQARADWAMSGMPELCGAVLAPALDRVARTGAELTRRRFRAALHGVRLDSRRPAGARPTRALEDDCERLWDEVEAFAAGPLAERAVRRFGPPGAPAAGARTGAATTTEPATETETLTAADADADADAQDPSDSRGASSP
ncbi:hypothetical protein [Streptomyces erythrochromogenes]|uniref:hypothetical protein n=1 Tax=Streptomyces erythrochromogenes TaxID=285574 RepID=UPI0036761776